MKYAIYCRVSRGDLNPENQKLQLEEYAKTKGWEFVTFEEIESSRKTRPIKESILQDIREGKFDGILIYKLDRWARSLQELIMNVQEITSRGKQFVVMTQPFDTTSSAGMLMMQILGAFAEFERGIIRERTMAGLERAKSQGKKLGRPFKINESRDVTEINKIKELLLKGLNDRQIAHQLGTSRYRIQKAITWINQSPPDNTKQLKGGLLG